MQTDDVVVQRFIDKVSSLDEAAWSSIRPPMFSDVDPLLAPWAVRLFIVRPALCFFAGSERFLWFLTKSSVRAKTPHIREALRALWDRLEHSRRPYATRVRVALALRALGKRRRSEEHPGELYTMNMGQLIPFESIASEHL